VDASKPYCFPPSPFPFSPHTLSTASDPFSSHPSGPSISTACSVLACTLLGGGKPRHPGVRNVGASFWRGTRPHYPYLPCRKETFTTLDCMSWLENLTGGDASRDWRTGGGGQSLGQAASGGNARKSDSSS